MYSKKPKENICGNCKHEIVLTVVKIAHDKKMKSQTVDCRHVGDSYLCLETNCQCLDPTGRDTALVGSRHPFNKIWNQDSLRGVITNW